MKLTQRQGLLALIVLCTLICCVIIVDLARAEQMMIKWDPVEEATGYKIYYSDEDKNNFQFDAKKRESVPLSELKIIPGKKYFYSVTAYNECDESEKSPPINYILKTFDPGPNIQPEFTFVIPAGITEIKIIQGGE